MPAWQETGQLDLRWGRPDRVADIDVDVEPFPGGGESDRHSYSDAAVLILVADDQGSHIVQVEDQVVVEVHREVGTGDGDDVLADGLHVVCCL